MPAFFFKVNGCCSFFSLFAHASTSSAQEKKKEPKKKKVSRSAYHAPNKFPFGLVAKSEFKTGAPKVKVKGAVERPADSKGRDKGKNKGKNKGRGKTKPWIPDKSIRG